MLTQDQIKANINAMEQQGASQSEIQQYLDSLKGSTTNTPQPSTPESGFLKNVLQSLVHVPATLVSTLASLGADVKSFAGAAGSGFKTMDFSEGDKIRQQGLDLGIFGNVKPVGGDINNQTFGGLAGNVAGLAGNAALDVATLGSDSLAKAVGESTLKQVGNIAAKNAGIGAGYSLASSVENGDNWLDTLLHTVEGAAVGGIAGPALHYAIPAVAKTVGGVASDVIDKGVLGGLESTANKKEIKDLIAKKGKGLGKNTSLKDELTIPENSLISEAKKYKSAEEFVKAQGTPVYTGKIGNVELDYNRVAQKGNQLPYGVHFTPDESIAKSFASGETKGMPTGSKGVVESATISAKNPFDVSATGNNGEHLFFEGSKQYNILQEIAKRDKLGDLSEIYSKKSGGHFIPKENISKYDDSKLALNPNWILNQAKPETIKSILAKNGYDPVIKYSMRGTKDPLGMGLPTFTDAYAVLDKSAIKTKSQLTDIWNKANKIGNKIDTTTSKIFGNVPEGEVGKITIPKNVEKGIDAGGEVLAELESMKGVNIPHDDTELRNAILETVKDGKFEYVEIPYGGDKKISFTPTIENLTEDTKKLANDQEKLITEKYNRSYSKKELDTVINAERQNGIKNYAVEDTDKYDKALAAEIKNQKFKKLTSAKDILSKIRSIKFDPTADSATQQARNDVKMALTNLLKKDFPGFAEMNNKIHKNFLVIDAFGNGLAKPGASIFEKLAGISGALAAAPQGIVASFATRNFASKLANHIFGGRYSLDKATKNFINESQPIIEKWISQGVSPKNIFSLIQEKYAYGKPSPETVLKIITELQGKADELSRQTTEVAAQKLAEQKSLIRIIKGMGNDANAIKEELVSQGINITDADAKTFAALNKNLGKSITPYIEKLARIGTIKQSTDQSQ